MIKTLYPIASMLLALALLFAGSAGHAQNLILNGDFEAYNACPNRTGQIDFSPGFSSFPSVKNWVTPNPGSSDYYNTCALIQAVRVPDPPSGYQPAHSGNGYTGIYSATGGTGYGPGREFISTKLPERLVKDERYCVSFWVSPTAMDIIPDGTKLSVNAVGAFISDTLPTGVMPAPSMDPPRFIMNDTNVHLTDTSRWYQIRGTYVAKGGEQWITIGVFFDGAMPAFSYLSGSDLSRYYGYIYVDDVSLQIAGSSYPVRRVPYCGEPLRLTANAATGPYRWSSGDTGRSVTVNSPGTYVCLTPGDCGNTSDTVVVMPTPIADTVAEQEIKVCYSGGLSLRLMSPVQGTRYLWSTGATTPEITVTAPGTYSCNVLSDCRIYPVRILVTKEAPQPPVLRDTMICQGIESPVLQTGYDDLVWYTATGAGPYSDQPNIKTLQPGRTVLYASRQRGTCISARTPVTITIHGLVEPLHPQELLRCADRPDDNRKIGERTGSGDSYTWSTGATSYLIPMPQYDGLYTRVVTNVCGSVTDSFHVVSAPCTDCVAFPNAFTPNGDGRNDAFNGLLRCPVTDYLFRVYNRWGQMIFVTSRPGERWDGTHNGRPADVGTYMYQCSFRHLISGETIRAQGDVLLIR